MDKMREEFEREFNVPDYLQFDGEDYMYYGEDPVLEEQSENTQALWRGFRVNNEIKDEEIRDLQEQIGYLRGDVINVNGIIKKRDEEIKKLSIYNKTLENTVKQDSRILVGFETRNKKLRDALGKIVDYVNITRAEDAFNMQRIAKEALRNGE